MSGIAIYMEGGGDSRDGRAALRVGIDALFKPLKDIAQRERLRWRLIVCGGRDAAFRAFRNAARGNDTIAVLLVDSEGPVSTTPTAHLAERDGWQLLFADGDAVHLMVQVMETWVVADVGALRGYYGRGFKPNQLPRRPLLEDVPKADIARALDRATAATSKGSYRKIRHASDLLARIDPEAVKQRCPHFDRLWRWLEQQVAGAPTRALAAEDDGLGRTRL